MTKIIRRQALRSISGGSLAALLCAGSQARAGEAVKPNGGALVEATLSLSQSQGRQLSGFIETGVSGGTALCSLVRQHPENPAIQSVFASPERLGGADGIRVTVSLYTEPVGSVTVALLHLGAEETAEPERLT